MKKDIYEIMTTEAVTEQLFILKKQGKHSYTFFFKVLGKQ